MRQVFSSPRLENVEGVARLLEEAGIEVRITDGRSYRGNRRGTFSYRDANAPKPAVWVVQSDDQVRAREILREAGLIDSTRHRDSFVASFHSNTAQATQADARKRRIARIKYTLLVVLLIAAGAMMVSMIRNRPMPLTSMPLTSMPSANMPAPAPPVEAQQASPPFDGSVQPTLAPVAQAAFAHELEASRLDVACLSIDGADVPAPMLESLQAQLKADPESASIVLAPASACERNPDENVGSRHLASGQPALIVDVTGFRPSAPDAGEVEYSAYHHRVFGLYRTLQVKRVDGEWQVTGVVRSASI